MEQALTESHSATSKKNWFLVSPVFSEDLGISDNVWRIRKKAGLVTVQNVTFIMYIFSSSPAKAIDGEYWLHWCALTRDWDICSHFNDAHAIGQGIHQNSRAAKLVIWISTAGF